MKTSQHFLFCIQVSLADVPKKYDIIVQPIFNAMYLEKKRMEQNLLRQKFVADFNDTNLEVILKTS